MQDTFARALGQTRDDKLYARDLCSRDALGLYSRRPSAARDDRVYCIHDDKESCIQHLAAKSASNNTEIFPNRRNLLLLFREI